MGVWAKPMKIPLARLASEKTKRKRIVFGATSAPRKMDEVRLYRIYMRVVNMWRDVAKPRIMAEYQRTIDIRALFDSAESVDDAIQQEANAVSRLFITLELAIRDWAVEIEQWQRGKWRGATLSATGVDISVMLQAQDVQQTLESVIRTNVALIKGVSAQQQREFVRIIHNGLSQRLTARQVAKELEAVYTLGRKRSILIASDQLQKAAVALDRERQFQAGGGREFVWAHSGKTHFRPWHKARNGLTFKWAGKPGDEGYVPADDLPGIPIRCGCRARFVLDLERIPDE